MPRPINPDKPINERQRKQEKEHNSYDRWNSGEDESFDPRHKHRWRKGTNGKGDDDIHTGRVGNSEDRRGGRSKYQKAQSDYVTERVSRAKLLLDALFDVKTAYWAEDDPVEQQEEGVPRIYDSERIVFTSRKGKKGAAAAAATGETSSDSDAIFDDSEGEEGAASLRHRHFQSEVVHKTRRFKLDDVRGRFGHLAGLNVQMSNSHGRDFVEVQESSSASASESHRYERAGRGAIPRRTGGEPERNPDNPGKFLRINVTGRWQGGEAVRVEDVSSRSEMKRGTTRILFELRRQSLSTLASRHHGMRADLATEQIQSLSKFELIYEGAEQWKVERIGGGSEGASEHREAIDRSLQDESRRQERKRINRR